MFSIGRSHKQKNRHASSLRESPCRVQVVMALVRVYDSTSLLNGDCGENLWNVLEGGEAGRPRLWRDSSGESAGLDRRPPTTIIDLLGRLSRPRDERSYHVKSKPSSLHPGPSPTKPIPPYTPPPKHATPVSLQTSLLYRSTLRDQSLISAPTA